MARLLIVDDSADTRDFCELIARLFQIRVEQALNADDAVERLSRGPVPDLVLLDLMMPGQSPEQFMSWLKGQPRLSGIQVVVISALREVGQRAREMGAAGALRKPFDMAAFVNILRRHAMNSGGTEQLSAI